MPKRTRTTRRLEVWLKDTDVALFVLNAQRRLVFFNSGCERLTGWSASDLLGQKCDYVSEPDSHAASAVLSALSPPPETWSGQPSSSAIDVPHRQTSPVPRFVYHFPLVDMENHVKALLGVMIHIPEPAAARSIPIAQRLHAELASLRQSLRRRFGEGTVIVRNPAMQRALEQIKLAQGSTSPVLFVGEVGTGKQHLARLLHYQSSVGRRSFVPIDCRTTSQQQLGGILSRLRADPDGDALQAGAVYLDDIGAAPSDFQLTLLKWLQSDAELSGVRVLAGATSALKPLVDSERFSSELYFALTALQIELPPLRERMDELEPLIQFFIEEVNRDAPVQVGGCSDDVWRQFRRYNWPGNVEELRRVIQEAKSACSGSTIDTENLPFRFRTGVTAQTVGPTVRSRTISLDQLLEQVEREHIEQALAECQNNKAKAADRLGITRPRLYRRMEILGIADTDPGGTDSAE